MDVDARFLDKDAGTFLAPSDLALSRYRAEGPHPRPERLEVLYEGAWWAMVRAPSLPPTTGVLAGHPIYPTFFLGADVPPVGRGVVAAGFLAGSLERGSDPTFIVLSYDETRPSHWQLISESNEMPDLLTADLARMAERYATKARSAETRATRKYFSPSLRKRLESRIDRHLPLSYIEPAEPERVDDCVLRETTREGRSWVSIKRGTRQIARCELPSGVLRVDNEADRPALLNLLEEHGYLPLRPFHHDRGLAIASTLSYYVHDPSFVLTLYFDGESRRVVEAMTAPGLHAALYLPSVEGLVSLTPGIEEIATSVLARHGLRVSVRGADVGVPANSRAAVYDRLTWDAYAITQVVPGGRQSPLSKATAAAREAAPPRRVPPILADTLHGQVVEALTECFGAMTPYGSLSSSTPWNAHPRGHRTSVLTVTQRRRLADAAPDITPPAEWVSTAQTAAEHVPGHGPFLAALLARTAFSTWWSQLPDLPTDAQLQNAPDNVFLTLTDPEFPSPDLPGSFAWAANDHHRLWVAAALFIQATISDQVPGPDETVRCSTCSRQFPIGALSLEHAVWLRRHDCCPDCADAAYNGSRTPWTAKRAAAVDVAIKYLAAEWGGPPPRLGLRLPLASTADNPEAWAQAVAHRILLPHLEDATAPAWTNLLASAGQLDTADTGLRMSRGVVSVASDGHLCRSLLERHIDDYLTAAGIPHTTEPHYPPHHQLNTGALRADWELPDGTYVEAAGLMTDLTYHQKMDRKRQLAQQTGIRLIVIEPDHLARLDEIFAEWSTARLT